MSLKDYIIRDIQEKFKYLPSAVYLALICIAMYIFVCLLRYLFTMREVSQADERRKKIVGKIWHMLFCGTFVAYMYTLIMIVYYSREPGSRTGVADMVLWSNWGMTLQMHAYFIENIVLFIPFGLIFPLVFKKSDCCSCRICHKIIKLTISPAGNQLRVLNCCAYKSTNRCLIR